MPRRRLGRAGAAALLAAAIATVAGTAFITPGAAQAVSNAPQLRVTFANGGRFPARALLLSTSGYHTLTPAKVHVQENGRPISGLSLTPLSTPNSGDFGVILLIDTSRSMAGRPLRQAIMAARRLAAERTGAQELGVITFNASVHVLVPLTSNSSSIDAALARTPQSAVGSHIYDATLEAIHQLQKSGVAAATVIVLSDGAEFGSRATQQAVAAASSAHHVRVYTVGVQDRSFKPAALRSLARAASGSYIASHASGLRRVFLGIESQLTSRYLVRYRSLQGLGQRIEVKAWVDGIPGSWIGRYSSPSLPTPVHPSAVATAPHPASASFWTSALALVAITLACALLLVGGVLVYLVPHVRQRVLRRRVGEFVGGERVVAPRQSLGLATLAAPVDRWLSGLARWQSFKEQVDIAGIERSPAELLALTAIATLAVAVILSVLLSAPLLSVPVCLLGPVVLIASVRWRVDRRRRLFADQLAGHLEEIGGAVRAGHAVTAAIAAMAEHAVEPSRTEFLRAVADERIGVPIDTALEPIARRMDCTDVEQLAFVASLTQHTGGNMAEVLDLMAAGVRERAELRRELDALTAQGRLSRWIVSALPPGLLVVVTLINPTYVSPLYHTATGIIVLCIAAAMVVGGSLVMRWILSAAR
jgi:tight adherence protein B